MARFETLLNKSEIVFEAESSVHPIRVATSRVKGFFEAVLDDAGRFDFSIPPSGRLEIAVDDLKSGNALIDRVIPAQLDTRRYPTIRAEIVTVQAENGSGRYFAVGDITFHGVTHRMENVLIIEWLDKTTLGIRGETVIDVREFRVTPPKLLILKVEPQVKVKLNFIVKLVV